MSARWFRAMNGTKPGRGARFISGVRRAVGFAVFGGFTLSIALVATTACSPNQPRDVVPESRDVRVIQESAAPRDTGAYAYVARRPHGAIGLVGTKHLATMEAEKLVDRLADELEVCARRQEAQGTLAQGAASLVVFADTRGNVDVSDMQLAPGGPVAANALECLVAPARGSILPPSNDSGVTALAIEATWGPLGSSRSGNKPVPPADAGSDAAPHAD